VATLLVGTISPICKYLTNRLYVKKANPENLAEIARALHQQVEPRDRDEAQIEPDGEAGAGPDERQENNDHGEAEDDGRQ
jgi:hypothetical protein